MPDEESTPSTLSIPQWQLDAEPAPQPETPNAPEPRRPAARTAPVRSAAPPPAPRRILEAMLFVSSVPLTPERAAEVIRGLSAAQFHEHIDELNRTYRTQGRPCLIQKQDQGYVLALRPTFRFVLEKLYGGVREARLAQPAVEVLAIVAYRQPLTRQEVETIRGHNSAAQLRQLLRRGLIGVVGRAEAGGAEVQYGTTPRFLDIFGLTSLDDLPETEDLSRL